MATKKLACEEAAELLSDDYGIVGLSARKRLSTHPDARNKLSKRIRAEGRELKRLRKTLLLVDKWPITVKERKQVAKEIDRIQKRKAK